MSDVEGQKTSECDACSQAFPAPGDDHSGDDSQGEEQEQDPFLGTELYRLAEIRFANEEQQENTYPDDA